MPFMPSEPAVKRVITFVDGQNLFHNVRSVFGYSFPNYDVQKLAQAVCAARGWTVEGVQFYTGVPSSADNTFWHAFWSNKMATMGRRGVVVLQSPTGLPEEDDPSPGSRLVHFPERRGKGN